MAAAKWFRKAAAQEHAGAQFYLGMCYSDGEGVELSHALAATWWEKAAGHGHAGAQGGLAGLYHEGKGVEQTDSGGGVVGESRSGR